MSSFTLARTSVALLLTALAAIAIACSGSASFVGTELDLHDPAPQFRLNDQFGEPLELSALTGKVVVLTFLYTSCPDVCPIVTETLRRAHVLLGKESEETQFLAVSVDPDRDSTERAFEYSQRMGMQDKWRFLVGNQEQLATVWQDYWLDPIRSTTGQQDNPEHDASDGTIGNGESEKRISATDSLTANSVLIGHTAPIFLIDRQGLRRVIFTSLSMDPQQLVHDIRLLLKQSS